MKLYFVRHGQSVDASNSLHQTFESPLSNLGQKQAKFLGKRLQNIKFDLIYTSPFHRARETAEIINKTLRTKMEVMEQAHEFKHPHELWR